MLTHVLTSLVCCGLVLATVLYLCQRWQLGSGRPAPRDLGDDLPPVSVLKPLKGLDANLEANLRSYFCLEHSSYELIFGVSDPGDPALALARSVAAEFPEVPTRFVEGGGGRVGLNPKVNNLAGILTEARHEILLISDSNIEARPDQLKLLLDRLCQPGVGLVSALIRGAGEQGLGGALERLQLNTFVIGGVAAASGLAGKVCTVGKSMMLRRGDLERVGGFRELARYLAEDQVCGLKIKDLGLGVVVAALPVTNVLGRLSISDFVGRHLRWARIRRRIAPVTYSAEILANPIVPALLQLAFDPGRRAVGQLVATVLAMSLISASAERRLGVHRPALAYPALELARGVLVGALWLVPFVSSSVTWRGKRFRVGPRTLLVRDEDGLVRDEDGSDALEWPEELQSEEAAA